MVGLLWVGHRYVKLAIQAVTIGSSSSVAAILKSGKL